MNRNGVIVYDLRVDPRQWSEMSEEQLAKRLFATREEIDGARLPLKVISRNRCPVVAPPSVLPKENAETFGIDRAASEAHWQYLTQNKELLERFRNLFGKDGFGKQEGDPDFMLYGGEFFRDSDRAHMETLRSTAPEELGRYDFPFRDPRLPEMLFRYRARNYPETLTDAETARWREFPPRADHGPGRHRKLRAGPCRSRSPPQLERFTGAGCGAVGGERIRGKHPDGIVARII